MAVEPSVVEVITLNRKLSLSQEPEVSSVPTT